MRVTLLPREVAARVITGATATLAWTAGAAIIVFSIPVLIETLVRNDSASALPLCLALLAVILAGIGVALWRMTPPVVVGYLVLASAAAVAYAVTLIEEAPWILEHDFYLVNRPMMALVAVGVSASSALGGMAWCLLGYCASLTGAVIAALITDMPVRTGFGPTMVLLLALVVHLTLFAIQSRQRRRLPGFDELERATLRRTATVDLARRTTAIVHDTVLNDLSAVMSAPDTLDQRMRDRLLADLETLESGAWFSATERVALPDAGQVAIRNDLARLASEFRWRGLTVNVTGVTDGVYIYDVVAGEALIWALRATLENVLMHSGSTTANVEIIYSDTEVTFMVADEGVGFDLDAVPASRLGVRESILRRMESAGGTARIWSAPGAGTTVMLGVPVVEVRDPGIPSAHQQGDSRATG